LKHQEQNIRSVDMLISEHIRQLVIYLVVAVAMVVAAKAGISIAQP
jgi:hypothetical protein